MKTLSCLFCWSLFCLLPSRADDWPEFQGEGRQYRWAETGTLADFKKGPPPLGQRSSGTVLWSPPAFAMKSVFVKNARELIRVIWPSPINELRFRVVPGYQLD
jgi:hypothetical protein